VFVVGFQIKNHFSVPFTIMRYCPTSRSMQSVGQAEPEREFHVNLETYRYHDIIIMSVSSAAMASGSVWLLQSLLRSNWTELKRTRNLNWSHCSVSCRCQLFVRPAGPLEGQYTASSSCVAWKEQVHCSLEVRSLLQCPASDSGLLPLMVSTLAVPDNLRHIASHGEEDWDPAYIIHLHPVATLRNLLPYVVRYIVEVRELLIQS